MSTYEKHQTVRSKFLNVLGDSKSGYLGNPLMLPPLQKYFNHVETLDSELAKAIATSDGSLTLSNIIASQILYYERLIVNISKLTIKNRDSQIFRDSDQFYFNEEFDVTQTFGTIHRGNTIDKLQISNLYPTQKSITTTLITNIPGVIATYITPVDYFINNIKNGISYLELYAEKTTGDGDLAVFIDIMEVETDGITEVSQITSKLFTETVKKTYSTVIRSYDKYKVYLKAPKHNLASVKNRLMLKIYAFSSIGTVTMKYYTNSSSQSNYFSTILSTTPPIIIPNLKNAVSVTDITSNGKFATVTYSDSRKNNITLPSGRGITSFTMNDETGTIEYTDGSNSIFRLPISNTNLNKSYMRFKPDDNELLVGAVIASNYEKNVFTYNTTGKTFKLTEPNASIVLSDGTNTWQMTTIIEDGISKTVFNYISTLKGVDKNRIFSVDENGIIEVDNIITQSGNLNTILATYASRIEKEEIERQEADNLKLNLSGGSLTGELTVSNNSEINYKGETLDSRFLNVKGGVITGDLTVAEVNYKGETLDTRFVNTSGDETITGFKTFSNNLVVTNPSEITYKNQNLDNRFVKVTDYNTHNTCVKDAIDTAENRRGSSDIILQENIDKTNWDILLNNSASIERDDSKLNLTGGVITGNLTVNGFMSNIKANNISLNIERPTVGGNWLTTQIGGFDGVIGKNHPDPEGGVIMTNNSDSGHLPCGYYMGVVKDKQSSSPNSLSLDFGKTTDLPTSLNPDVVHSFIPYMSLRDGKLGINNTNPTQALDIVGNAVVSGGLIVTNPSEITYKNETLDTRFVKVDDYNSKNKSIHSFIDAEETERISKDYILEENIRKANSVITTNNQESISRHKILTSNLDTMNSVITTNNHESLERDDILTTNLRTTNALIKINNDTTIERDDIFNKNLSITKDLITTNNEASISRDEILSRAFEIVNTSLTLNNTESINRDDLKLDKTGGTITGSLRITEPNVDIGVFITPVSQSVLKMGATDFFPQIHSIRNSNDTDNTDLQFWTSGINQTASHAMTIKGHSSHGRVGIGTTDPMSSLHVVGDVVIDGKISSTTITDIESDIKYMNEIITISNNSNIEHNEILNDVLSKTNSLIITNDNSSIERDKILNTDLVKTNALITTNKNASIDRDDMKLNLTGGTITGNLTLKSKETTLNVISTDETKNTTLNIHGEGNGTSTVYVGKSSISGGGIEYNGGDNLIMNGSGIDYTALFRRQNSVNSWTAKNSSDNNDWEFRGDVKAKSVNIMTDLYAKSATITSSLSAKSATITGDLSANSATITGEVSIRSSPTNTDNAFIILYQKDDDGHRISNDSTDNTFKIQKVNDGIFTDRFTILPDGNVSVNNSFSVGNTITADTSLTTGTINMTSTDIKNNQNNIRIKPGCNNPESPKQSWFEFLNNMTEIGSTADTLDIDILDTHNRISTRGTKALVLNTNEGFIGIGETNPIEKLHVDGNAIVSGTVTATTGNIITSLRTPVIQGVAENNYGKIQLWSDESNCIGLNNSMTYGSVNHTAMTFTVDGDANKRGWVWRRHSYGKNQGSMSLNTNGILTVASKVRIGYGINDVKTATQALDVCGNATLTGDLFASSVNLTNGLEITKIQTKNPFIRLTPSTPVDNIGLTNIFMGTSQNTNYGISLNAWRSGINAIPKFVIKTHNNNPNGIDVFTIQNDGNVGIGTTTPSEKLQVSGNAIVSGNTTSGTILATGLVSLCNGTRSLIVNGAGFLTTYVSDSRLKENIEPINEKETHSKLLNLEAKTFNWIDKEQNENIKEIGLIAQEVKLILPELVFENNNGMYGIHYDKISVLLIQSIQQLQKQNNDMNTQITEMKNQIKELIISIPKI
jgi:hypothetical protein